MKTSQQLKELSEFLAENTDPKNIQKILKDLLTPQEIPKILERLEIIKLLDEKKSQRVIKKKLNISIALVTRGSRALKKNHGGFPIYLQYLSQKKK